MAAGQITVASEVTMSSGSKAITKSSIEQLLTGKITQLSAQPEFCWKGGQRSYEQDPDGNPAVRAAVAGCSVDFDLWPELRSPAKIGLYPAGFEEIWDYYANNRKRRTDASGRATIYQLAEPFSEARKRYRRVLIISAMLPLSSEVFAAYREQVRSKSVSPWDGYCKAWSECNQLLDRGITRAAMGLSGADRIAVAMNDATVEKVSKEAIPLTRQGDPHGVCKGVNYSQKSIAVLTGPAQFRVSRIVFRDETTPGGVRRLVGPLRSMVIFHSNGSDVPADGKIRSLSEQWQRELRMLSDFTVSAREVNNRRFCTYLPSDLERGCGKCLAFCPSGALANSSPGGDGKHPRQLLAQEHRFWDGFLQFDNGSCCDDRGQLQTLYDEWMCGRCVAVCAAVGNRRPQAAEWWSTRGAGA
jgi:ferredoxin